MKTTNIKAIALQLILWTLLFMGCEKDDQPVNEAPEPFTVSANASGNSAILKWTTAIDPDGDTVTYSVQLENKTVLEKSMAKEYTLYGLEYETSYSGKVIATDSEGLSSETPFNFTTGDTPNSPPSKPILISPSLDAIDVTLTPEFTWKASTDSDGDTVTYHLYIDTNSPPASKYNGDISSTSYAFMESLRFNTQYYWKIIAKDENGGTAESDIGTFTTEGNQAPTNFNLLEVANSATGVDLLPSFKWESSTDPEGLAILYDLYLDTNSDPVTKVKESTVTTSYQTTTELLQNTRYYWKVIAKDQDGAETSSAVWSFTTRDLVSGNQITDNADFSARYGHTSVVFDNKMWVIGGESSGGTHYDDIWNSTDGENWTEQTADAPFGLRSRHASVVFDEKIWIVAGRNWYSAGSALNDVWYTEDGTNWKLATANADFEARYEHKMVVFDNKMWLLGGFNQNGSYNQNQVWNSTDGITWTKVTDNAGISFSTSEFIVFNNKIWRISSYNDSNIYSSTDGIKWTLEAENTPIGQRVYHELALWDNKIWLVSGSDRAINEFNELPDVWYSEDGKTWQLASGNAGISATAFHTLAVFNDKIWKIAGGGGFGSSAVYNDVWTIGY